jgi:thiazole synthase
MKGPLTLYGKSFDSRFLLGTALYSSPQVMVDSVKASACNIVTLGLRRQNPQDKDGKAIWDAIADTGCTLLPNTAGCKSAKEAITLAEMSRITTNLSLIIIGKFLKVFLL